MRSLITFFHRLLAGPRDWSTLAEAERKAIMSASNKKAHRLRGKQKSSRVDVGTMLPGEGSYTNSSNREKFVGSGDSALARSLAEDRAKAIEEAKRKK